VSAISSVALRSSCFFGRRVHQCAKCRIPTSMSFTWSLCWAARGSLSFRDSGGITICTGVWRFRNVVNNRTCDVGASASSFISSSHPAGAQLLDMIANERILNGSARLKTEDASQFSAFQHRQVAIYTCWITAAMGDKGGCLKTKLYESGSAAVPFSRRFKHFTPLPTGPWTTSKGGENQDSLSHRIG
jgi:hypothetical protein